MSTFLSPKVKHNLQDQSIIELGCYLAAASQKPTHEQYPCIVSCKSVVEPGTIKLKSLNSGCEVKSVGVYLIWLSKPNSMSFITCSRKKRSFLKWKCWDLNGPSGKKTDAANSCLNFKGFLLHYLILLGLCRLQTHFPQERKGKITHLFDVRQTVHCKWTISFTDLLSL